MKSALTIAWRELRAYFLSPIAYVVLGFFLVPAGWFYSNIVIYFHNISIQGGMMGGPQPNLTEGVVAPFYHNLAVILLFIIPLITMRLLAEEKKLKTAELLFTAPLHTWQIIVGKFLGAMGFFAFMLLTISYAPAFLFLYGNPEAGPVLASNLGMLLLGASFIGVGLFCSSLTENQIVAAVITFGVLLVLFVVKWASMTVGQDFADLISYLSILEHYDGFVKGLIDTRDLVYYASFTFICLFFTWLKLEAHRWA